MGTKSPAKEEDTSVPAQERVGVGKNARYVRREENGRCPSAQAKVGRSPEADRRGTAKTASKPGHSDTGDRRK